MNRVLQRMLAAHRPWIWPLLILLGPPGASPTRAGTFPDSLPPRRFLAIARRPLLVNAWVRASGLIQGVFPGGKRRRDPVAFDARFQPRRFQAEILVGNRALGRIDQTFASTAGPGRRETAMTARGPGIQALQTYGIRPEDISLSFLYWKFVRDLPKDSVRGQPCRVFILRSPDEKHWVHLWLHAHYVFPMRVYWFDGAARAPVQKLEFKDFKRRGKLWFIREMILTGTNWKTRIRLRRISLHRVADTPPPADLFTALERAAARPTGR